MSDDQPHSEDAPGLVGRAELWRELIRLLSPSSPGDGATLLVGSAGIGKSALVDRFATAAVAAGHPVVRAHGRSGTTSLPYAGLRDLLGGTDQAEAVVEALPPGQRDALRAALAGSADGIDLLSLRLATSAALEALAGERVLVLVVDDVDWVDAPTFDLLLTVSAAIVWNQVPVVALFSCREDRMPLELADLARVVTVPPLPDHQAERLLDTMVAGNIDRARVVSQAAGNPLALIELSARRDVPDNTVRLYADRIAALSPDGRRALAFAAAGESRISVIAAADPSITARSWQDATEAGLIEVLDGWVRFRHPLVEYAALAAAGKAVEWQLHRLLARAVPNRFQALWHRASAAEGDDPELAQELLAAAQEPAADPTTALRLLELAAAMLPQARRGPVLLMAAGRAAAVGRINWATLLLDNARAAADRAAQPDLYAEMTALASLVQTVRGRVAAGAELLRAALADPGPVGVPALTIVTATAGLPAFLLGSPDLDESIRGGLARLPAASAEGTLMPRAVAAPEPELTDMVQAIADPQTPAEVMSANAAGAAALLLDQPEDALRLTRAAVRMVLNGTAPGVFLTAPGMAGWAMIDLGRWAEAEQMIVPLLSQPVAAEAAMIRTGAYAQLAVIAFNRGRPDAAADLLERARLQLDAFDIPAFALRLRWAEGTAAMADEEYDRAFALLSAAADAAGVRHGWQVLVLPDLVSAAMRVGATAAAMAVVERIAGRGDWLTPRRAARLAAARVLLADDLPETPSGGWPYEDAVLAVEVADRMRRSHQPAEARALLVEALETFDRVRAVQWVGRAESDLRLRTQARADVFATLTAQQEQIARLAAQGMTNRQIGEQLFLSPRTVGSHLYKIFPLLGVPNRTRLSDLVARAERHRSNGG